MATELTGKFIPAIIARPPTIARLFVMDQLTQAVADLTEGQRQLTEGQQRLEVQMGEVRGWALEQRYHTHAPAYFGRLLRQVQPVDVGMLSEALGEQLEERELAEVLLADLILTGQLPTPPGPAEIWTVPLSGMVCQPTTSPVSRDSPRNSRRAPVELDPCTQLLRGAAGPTSTLGEPSGTGFSPLNKHRSTLLIHKVLLDFQHTSPSRQSLPCIRTT